MTVFGARNTRNIIHKTQKTKHKKTQPQNAGKTDVQKLLWM